MNQARNWRKKITFCKCCILVTPKMKNPRTNLTLCREQNSKCSQMFLDRKVIFLENWTDMWVLNYDVICRPIWYFDFTYLHVPGPSPHVSKNLHKRYWIYLKPMPALQIFFRFFSFMKIIFRLNKNSLLCFCLYVLGIQLSFFFVQFPIRNEN